jgi:hypothetical protein
MRRHALLIVACPRSGATTLAGALACAGAHPGRTFVTAPSGEPAATWQCAPLVALNDRLLAVQGLRWDSLVGSPERWRERPQMRALAVEADATIASEFGDAPVVVLHDPRLSLTTPFWRERLDAAGFDVSAALVVRRPAEVAASLSKREPFAPEKTLALWLHYLVEAERGTRGLPRAFVTYDRLLDAPAGVLSFVISESRLGLRLDRAQREAALASIRPDLKHFGDERLAGAGHGLSSGIDAALDEGYRSLASLTPGADPRRTIEALAQQAHVPLVQAIPPWLKNELESNRVHAERCAEMLAEMRVALDAARAGAALQSDRQTLGARMDETLARLRDDVGRITSTLADQPVREQSLREELVQAQRDLADERIAISRLSEALERERASGEAQAARLALAQTHLEALVAEVEQARTAEQSWTEHNRALASDLDDARIALHAMQSERDTLRHECDEARRHLDRLKAEVESARTDLKILDNDRTALTARAQSVDHAAAALREELARRANVESALTGERDRLASDLRKHADRMALLERELAKRIAELTALSGRHDTLARTLAALERSWLGRKALAGTRRSPA